jgi:hypothetical protein
MIDQLEAVAIKAGCFQKLAGTKRPREHESLLSKCATLRGLLQVSDAEAVQALLKHDGDLDAAASELLANATTPAPAPVAAHPSATITTNYAGMMEDIPDDLDDHSEQARKLVVAIER